MPFRIVLAGVVVFILLIFSGVLCFQKKVGWNAFRRGWLGNICHFSSKKNNEINIVSTNGGRNIEDSYCKVNIEENFLDGLHHHPSSATNHPTGFVPRADSVLISQLEVEYVQQMQRFLSFPVLHLLSNNSGPPPTFDVSYQ